MERERLSSLADEVVEAGKLTRLRDELRLAIRRVNSIFLEDLSLFVCCFFFSPQLKKILLELI